jgi:hypothetical protein
MRIFIITVVCLALALAAPAFARMYKWTDKDGKIHFTDRLNEVPLDQRNKKHIKKMQSSKEGKRNIRTTRPPAPPAPKHLGKKKEGSENKDTGIDHQRVKELKRLIQKH